MNTHDVRALLASSDDAAANRMRALLDAAGEHAFDRRHFTPGHFTASAFVVSPGRDAVLLVRHRALGRWLQPGGHVAASDMTLADTALREVAEETGQHAFAGPPVLIGLDVHPIPANPRRGEPAHEHFDVRFVLHATSRALAPADDVDDAGWFDPATAERVSDASVATTLRHLIATGHMCVPG